MERFINHIVQSYSMARQFSQIGETDITRLLSSDNVSGIIDSRRLSGIESLYVDGRPAIISKQLGSGGSKEVYDVSVDGEHYALALPGTADPAQIIIAKWSKVLKEPTNTNRLRELGLHVNDLCRVVPSTVNGHEFPALVMKRYSDHNFPIYDSKNPQGNYHELIKPDQQVTDEQGVSFFSPVGTEIVALVRNGAQLGRDCFNLCAIDGVPHLYLNDLGAATFGEIPQGDLERYVAAYVSSALGAFVNTATERVYRENPYVHSMGDLESSLQPKLVAKVMDTLKESSPSSRS